MYAGGEGHGREAALAKLVSRGGEAVAAGDAEAAATGCGKGAATWRGTTELTARPRWWRGALTGGRRGWPGCGERGLWPRPAARRAAVKGAGAELQRTRRWR